MRDALKNRHRMGNRGRRSKPTRIAVAALIWLVCLLPMTAGAEVPETGMTAGQEVAGTPDQPESGPSPQGVLATRVEGVTVHEDGDDVSIHVRGDGEFSYSTFRLSDPDRFVVDLPGVVNGLSNGYFSVGAARVEQVRVAQFRGDPDPVMRVVIDLEGPAIPSIETTADELILTFGSTHEMTADSAVDPMSPFEDEPTLEVEPTSEVEPTLEVEVAVAVEEPAAEAVAAWEPVEEEAAPPTPAPVVPEAVSPPMEVAAMEMADESDSAADESSDAVAEEVAALQDVPAPEEAVEFDEVAVEEPWAEPIVEVENPPIQVAQIESSDFETTSEVELYEAAQVEMDAPAPAPMVEPASIVSEPPSFDSRTVGGGSRVYRGEPMDLTLRDADIKDVLRSFARISGLNVVVQPGVTGKVTVELTQVPWDQALEQILKINGLGYELDGNIMRIASTSLLQKEAAERSKLEALKAQMVPLRTVMKRISYGNPNDIAQVLQRSVMSQRGSVVVDRRTNTLIIKELPSFMDVVISVIENLDTPEPQVMIEARIVETTKRFERTLGIEWNFLGISDAAHGNTTGLEFPNNGSVEGGVNLLTGGNNGFLALSMGNILSTFQLDATLNAAENEGLINILSAPKVATLNNEQASIQSGLQIPIQTIANNTVSVQFVNATLRLDVTPHVTAEGTVLMDINIQKREPQLAFAVVGATNAPISTKEARTKVIVRDGGTTVIGGIYEVSTDQGSDRVPGFADIPILGGLFKNKRRTDENKELLIFITPRVIKL